MIYEIRHYLTIDEKDPYLDWLRSIRDALARVVISRRINFKFVVL
jgi:putative component of toxin-antitoxin plasmid stabilization module